MSPIWETFANASVSGYRTTVKGVTYFLARVQMATRGTSFPRIGGTAANLTHSYYTFELSHGKYIHRFTQDALFVESVNIAGSSNSVGGMNGNNSLVTSGVNGAQRVWTPANYYTTMVTVRNNGSGNSFSSSVDTSNNFYFQGYGVGNIPFNKFNSAGTLQWQRVVNGASIGDGDTAGNTFVSSDGANPTVHKIDTNGTYQWGRQCSTFSTAGTRIVKNDGSGGVFISSNVTSGIPGFARLDSAGNASWARQVTISTVTMVGIATGPDGSVYWILSNTGPNSAYVIKFNSSGTLLWQRFFTMASNGVCAVQNGYAGSNFYVDNDAIYIALVTPDSNGGYEHTYCLKYPVDGSVTGSYNLGAGSLVISASSLTINSFTPSWSNNNSSAIGGSGDSAGSGAPTLYTTAGQTIIKVP
jgi:hypothetical protein